MTRALTSNFCDSVMTAIVFVRFVIMLTVVVVNVGMMPARKWIAQTPPDLWARAGFGIRQKAGVKLRSESI
jgi:hypothetical protein